MRQDIYMLKVLTTKIKRTQGKVLIELGVKY